MSQKRIGVGSLIVEGVVWWLMRLLLKIGSCFLGVVYGLRLIYVAWMCLLWRAIILNIKTFILKMHLLQGITVRIIKVSISHATFCDNLPMSQGLCVFLVPTLWWSSVLRCTYISRHFGLPSVGWLSVCWWIFTFLVLSWRVVSFFDKELQIFHRLWEFVFCFFCGPKNIFLAAIPEVFLSSLCVFKMEIVRESSIAEMGLRLILRKFR